MPSSRLSTRPKTKNTLHRWRQADKEKNCVVHNKNCTDVPRASVVHDVHRQVHVATPVAREIVHVLQKVAHPAQITDCRPLAQRLLSRWFRAFRLQPWHPSRSKVTQDGGSWTRRVSSKMDKTGLVHELALARTLLGCTSDCVNVDVVALRKAVAREAHGSDVRASGGFGFYVQQHDEQSHQHVHEGVSLIQP